MPRTINASPLSESPFAPYGGILSAGLQLPTTLTNPSATKSLEVVKPTDLYAQAPSGQPGRPVIHVEVVKPKNPQTAADGSRVIVLDRMERHPFTSQIFIPMSADVAYLAIVADGSKTADEPDLDTLKVFVAGSGQGICYGAGVWHASMSVVGKSPITFAVVQSMNGVTSEDVEFFQIKAEDVVEMHF